LYSHSHVAGWMDHVRTGYSLAFGIRDFSWAKSCASPFHHQTADIPSLGEGLVMTARGLGTATVWRSVPRTFLVRVLGKSLAPMMAARQGNMRGGANVLLSSSTTSEAIGGVENITPAAHSEGPCHGFSFTDILRSHSPCSVYDMDVRMRIYTVKGERMSACPRMPRPLP